MSVVREVRTKNDLSQVDGLGIALGACEMMCRLSYCQDRALCPPQYPLGNGSHHQPINSSQTVSSHNNQTHSPLFRKGENQIGHQAVLYDALGLNSSQGMKPGKPLHFLRGVGADLPTDFLIGILI